jgi:hypothetical protein
VASRVLTVGGAQLGPINRDESKASAASSISQRGKKVVSASSG